jgi:hypothetical protein
VSNGIEKRVLRLERLVSKGTRKPQVCNCRIETRYHDANCLAAILNGTRICPVHGFRELGFFFWTAKQYPLQSEDNQVCPCSPHPWRSFLLSRGPHTWEGHHAAQDAWNNLPDAHQSSIQEESLQTDATLVKYGRARQEWIERTGRELPDPEELKRLQWERVRNRRRQI